jgi:hypothetical protein
MRMGQSIQDVRDLIALARRLRRIADEHPRDHIYHRLLTAAAEIEQRALLLVEAGEAPAPEKDARPHAPINLMI